MKDPGWNEPILYNIVRLSSHRPVRFYRGAMGVISTFLIKSSGSMI